MAAHTKDTLRIQGAATTRACSHDKIMVFYAGTYRVRELVDTVLLHVGVGDNMSANEICCEATAILNFVQILTFTPTGNTRLSES
ncbi:unnamed protein product [Clonostachys chloroleuca]|uniref:Uncharacterized protein n=1 Tax=Clonostachys chloroleuca TaxID=1926264 RepID=A0AA35Q9C3_9HYPO|nr:unnamed protein product [Clonostachys chloroleuca]